MKELNTSEEILRALTITIKLLQQQRRTLDAKIRRQNVIHKKQKNKSRKSQP